MSGQRGLGAEPGVVATTFAGAAGHFGSMDGAGATACFQYPNAVAVDSSNNVSVAGFCNNTIRKIT